MNGFLVVACCMNDDIPLRFFGEDEEHLADEFAKAVDDAAVQEAAERQGRITKLANVDFSNYVMVHRVRDEVVAEKVVAMEVA